MRAERCWDPDLVLTPFKAFFRFSFFDKDIRLCYLSWACSWGRRRALSFGRNLCAVDHDSVRVWLCTSLQNKLYLLPLPIRRLLEGGPNSPPKALQEGRSGCRGGRQLCDGEGPTLEDIQTLTWLMLFSYIETSLINASWLWREWSFFEVI